MSEYWRWYNGFAGKLKDVKAAKEELTIVLDMKDSAPALDMEKWLRRTKIGKIIWLDLRNKINIARARKGDKKK